MQRITVDLDGNNGLELDARQVLCTTEDGVLVVRVYGVRRAGVPRNEEYAFPPGQWLNYEIEEIDDDRGP
jgi:hypothetical protein